MGQEGGKALVEGMGGLELAQPGVLHDAKGREARVGAHHGLDQVPEEHEVFRLEVVILLGVVVVVDVDGVADGVVAVLAVGGGPHRVAAGDEQQGADRGLAVLGQRFVQGVGLLDARHHGLVDIDRATEKLRSAHVVRLVGSYVAVLPDVVDVVAVPAVDVEPGRDPGRGRRGAHAHPGAGVAVAIVGRAGHGADGDLVLAVAVDRDRVREFFGRLAPGAIGVRDRDGAAHGDPCVLAAVAPAHAEPGREVGAELAAPLDGERHLTRRRTLLAALGSVYLYLGQVLHIR